MIYFDHAASSFPKPKKVVEAVAEALVDYGANPGRGGHALAKKAADQVYKTRVKLASFFGLNDPKRVLFFQNATGAINQGIKGLNLREGDHVITTSYEHNAVRRPLEYLKQTVGIRISYVQPDHNGHIDEKKVIQEISEATKLIVVTHGSNLTGMILPLEKLGAIAQKHGIKFMVDASQTAGVIPIDMEKMHIDLLAFAGHKGLLGPQGTGALLVKEGIELEPLFHGGTGNYSELIEQPKVWPERFESGTLNTPGIVGLLAGIETIEEQTLTRIYHHEKELVQYAIKKLGEIEDVHLFGPDPGVDRLAVIPFVIKGIDSHEIAMILDEHYQIAVRAGLHCTPLAHESIGTHHSGAVRVSFGMNNTKEEVDQLIQAIKEIREGFLD